jgi:hypothetical protein
MIDCSNELSQITSLVALEQAMNSASRVDNATIVCCFDDQEIGAVDVAEQIISSLP